MLPPILKHASEGPRHLHANEEVGQAHSPNKLPKSNSSSPRLSERMLEERGTSAESGSFMRTSPFKESSHMAWVSNLGMLLAFERNISHPCACVCIVRIFRPLFRSWPPFVREVMFLAASKLRMWYTVASSFDMRNSKDVMSTNKSSLRPCLPCKCTCMAATAVCDLGKSF